MIYKNEFKDYFKSGLIYGLIMGIFIAISTMNMLIGVILGIFAGALFGFFIFIFSRSIEKKMIKKRQEISAERRIICDGAATFRGQGGWLFFTDSALEFYPHKFNSSTKFLLLPNNKLNSTVADKNKIIITAFGDKKFEIIVVKSTEWKKQIDGFFKAAEENTH